MFTSDNKIIPFNILFKVNSLQSLDEREKEISEIEEDIKKEKEQYKLQMIQKYSIENVIY